MVSKVWASMRTSVFALAKWCRSGAFDTPAFKHTAKKLEAFSDPIEGLPNFALFEKSWSISNGLERLQIRCELRFLEENSTRKHEYNIDQVIEVLNAVVNRSQKTGQLKARTAHEDFIAKALVGGASMGHKLTKVDAALPPLKLVFKEKVEGEIVRQACVDIAGVDGRGPYM